MKEKSNKSKSVDQTNTEKHCKEYAQNYRVLLTIFTIKTRLIHPIRHKKSIYLRLILWKYHKIGYPTIHHSKIRFPTNKNMDIHSDVHGPDKEILHIFPDRFFHTNPEHIESFLLKTADATPVFNIYAITVRTIAVISGPSAKLFCWTGDLNYHGLPPFCIFSADTCRTNTDGTFTKITRKTTALPTLRPRNALRAHMFICLKLKWKTTVVELLPS